MHLHREPVQPRPPVRRHRLARVRRPLLQQLRPRLQEQRGEQHLDPLPVRREPEHRDGADPPATELVQHRAAAQGRRRPAEQPGLARAVGIGDLHPRGADLVAARLGRRQQRHVDAVPGHQLDRLVRAGLGLLGRARPLGPGQQLADAPQCVRRPGVRAGVVVRVFVVRVVGRVVRSISSPPGRTCVRSRTDLPDRTDIPDGAGSVKSLFLGSLPGVWAASTAAGVRAGRRPPPKGAWP